MYMRIYSPRGKNLRSPWNKVFHCGRGRLQKSLEAHAVVVFGVVKQRRADNVN